MRRVGEIHSTTMRFITVVAGLVFLAGLVSALVTGVPLFGPQRVDRPEDGFGVSFPRDWELADATAYEEDWWDPVHGPPAQQHAEFLAEGGVLRARKPVTSEADHEQCTVFDLSVKKAQDYVNNVNDMPHVSTLESRRLELPGGAAIAWDIATDDGWRWGVYLVTDGRRWLRLECGSRNPPEDGWLSIAETLAFLPAGA